MRWRVAGPGSRQYHRDAPAEHQVQFVVRVRPEDHYRDEIVQEESFDEHPHEHGGPGVLEDDVEPLAQNRLMII